MGYFPPFLWMIGIKLRDNLHGTRRLFACFLPLALEHQAVTKKTANRKNTKASPTAEVKMAKEFLMKKVRIITIIIEKFPYKHI